MTPASRNPATPVQRAFVARLKASADLQAALAITAGGAGRQAVYDGPPEGADYPYVVVGDHLSIPDNDLTSIGREGTETVHVWTKARTNRQGQDIADVVTALFDHRVAEMTALLAGDGHKCVTIRQEFDQALRDPDPQLRHHVVRFRIQTQQTS